MPNEPRQAFGAERVPLHDSLNKGPEEDDDMVGLRVDLHRLRIQDEQCPFRYAPSIKAYDTWLWPSSHAGCVQ